MRKQPALSSYLIAELDPVEGGSANDYDYVNGDCINNYDLDGKYWTKDRTLDFWKFWGPEIWKSFLYGQKRCIRHGQYWSGVALVQLDLATLGIGKLPRALRWLSRHNRRMAKKGTVGDAFISGTLGPKDLGMVGMTFLPGMAGASMMATSFGCK